MNILAMELAEKLKHRYNIFMHIYSCMCCLEKFSYRQPVLSHRAFFCLVYSSSPKTKIMKYLTLYAFEYLHWFWFGRIL